MQTKEYIYNINTETIASLQGLLGKELRVISSQTYSGGIQQPCNLTGKTGIFFMEQEYNGIYDAVYLQSIWDEIEDGSSLEYLELHVEKMPRVIYQNLKDCQCSLYFSRVIKQIEIYERQKECIADCYMNGDERIPPLHLKVRAVMYINFIDQEDKTVTIMAQGSNSYLVYYDMKMEEIISSLPEDFGAVVRTVVIQNND